MPKRSFSRYPIPKKDILKKALEKTDGILMQGSPQKNADVYIRNRIGDIISSTEVILREKQKIAKAKRCIKLALSIMTEKASKNIKTTNKNFYKDLLNYSLKEVKSKYK